MKETERLVNYKNLIGKRAYFAKEDKYAGLVKDIVFLLDQKKAVALVLERGMLPGLKSAILFANILSTGEDGVILDSKANLLSLKEVRKSFKNYIPGNYQGKRICSKTGKEYGRVYDIIINLYTGAVEAIEASDGLIQDAYSGRKLIPFMDQVEFAKEMIVIDKISEEEILTGGGLKEI